MKAQKIRNYISGIIGIVFTAVLFIVPFLFIISQALKPSREASTLAFSWPSEVLLVENFLEVIEYREFMLLRAFWNSIVLTVASVVIVVVLGALIAYVIQRRPSAFTKVLSGFVLAGLIIPPAVVPTVFLMQDLNVFRTLDVLVLI